MCKEFSCVVKKNGKSAYWKMGLNSHDQLKWHFKLADTEADGLCNIEIIPKDYLYPEKDYTFMFDNTSKTAPDWWKANVVCWTSTPSGWESW